MKVDNGLSADLLVAWEASFREEAESDGYRGLRDHMSRFELDLDPQQMVAATVDFVAACVAFSNLDGDTSPAFLALQRYQPDPASGGVYALTFDVLGQSAARLVTTADLRGVDLADLYGMPWSRYKMVGYSRCIISRVDGIDLAAGELEELERLMTDDLCFDYADDEIDYWFDPDSFPGALVLEVQDHVAGDL